MTPAAHATAATTELANSTAATTDPTESAVHARAAAVHAVLAGKAGTGANYTNAETELSAADNLREFRLMRLDRALAYAHLAD